MYAFTKLTIYKARFATKLQLSNNGFLYNVSKTKPAAVAFQHLKPNAIVLDSTVSEQSKAKRVHA